MAKHRFFLSVFLALVGLFVLGGTGSAMAQAEKRALKLFAAEFPGYSGGAAPAPGILTEMVERAAKAAGYKVLHKIVPWARALKLVQSMDDALIVGLSRLPERESDFTWIVHHLDVETAFMSLGEKIDSYEQARQLTSVGVHRASSHEIGLMERGFTNLRSFNKVEHPHVLLERGRVEAWFGVINEFTRRSHDGVSSSAKAYKYGTPVLNDPLWLGGSKSLSPEIARDLEAATRQFIESGGRAELLLKYFGRE